jgi:hypothetical protein
MTNPYVLYRIYGDGELLYIGATASLSARLASHTQNQPWWDEADEIKLERVGSFEELAAAEKAAIQYHAPKYNVIHGSEPLPYVSKPRGPRGEGSLYQRADGIWVGKVEMASQNGKRRYRYVSSKDRDTAALKFEALKAGLDG